MKLELKEQQKSSVTEYNKKWAIFEYLRRLGNKVKQKASIEAAQLVSI